MKALPKLNFKLKNPFKTGTKANETKARKKLSTKKKVLLIVVLLLLIFITAFAVFSFSQKKNQRNNMEASFRTETAFITRQTLTNSISATGTVESAETKTVNTKMTNIKVTAVHVKEGDYVEAGTVICEFDSSDYEEALAEAKNNYSVNQQIENLNDDYTTIYNEALEEAEEGLENVRETRDDAKDAYNEARSNPETPANELEALKQAYEQAQAKREEYQKQYEEAIKKAQYNYDKAVLEEQLISETQEEKTIDEYTELIEECVVTVDMSGVITNLNVTEGNNFEGGDIYTIQDNDHFIVSSTVDEYDISSIEKGMSAYIKTDATGDVEMTGSVTYVAIAPASTGGAMGAVSSSASYRIEVTIDNPDANLRAGMTAKISIALEESQDALTVPYDAVTANPDGTSSITVDMNGERKIIQVTTGLETDYYTEVISDEISEGMTVYLTTPMILSNPENNDEESFPGFGNMPGNDGMPSGDGMPDRGSMPDRGENGGGMPSGGGPGGF